jgi:alpha-glucosidase (family GH31 glycosyl hydrolase)
MKPLSSARRILGTVVCVALIILAVYYLFFEITFRGRPFSSGRHGNPPLTPPWALECWLWEDDSNTRERINSLLAGYARNDIPVRTILIDSPWSLRYNDFNVDTIRYPDVGKWFGDLHDKGIRIVLWMTSMINSSSKDTRIRDSEEWFNEAASKGYVTGKSYQIKWWKGKGGFIDYTNKDATDWWRGLQDEVHHYGIDGWKLDGTATLFMTMAGPIPFFFMMTRSGLLTTRHYMDHYYRDEYRNGLEKNPEFITLSRSIDRHFHPEGFAPLDAAPVTWVGDQTHTWRLPAGTPKEAGPDNGGDGRDGIELAIRNVLRAAKVGYNIIGSDIGGFSGDSIPPHLYIRWAQFSAFCGLYLNGGHGERALWKRTGEELSIIKKYSWLHTELVPYIYSYVISGHSGGPLLQQPIQGKYQYLFGDYLLVAPVYMDAAFREVTLPNGNWRYFFNDSMVVRGQATFNREYPLDEYPVYIREGAVIPMNISHDYTGIGDSDWEGYLTLLIYPDASSHFKVWHPDKSGSTDISVTKSEKDIKINLDGVHKPHILCINSEKQPAGVKLDGKILSSPADYRFDESRHKLIIRTISYSDGKYVISR